MSADSAAISGDSIQHARSFYKATTTGGDVAVAIAQGGYEVCSTTDCDLQLCGSGVTTTGVPNAQPAVGSHLPLIRLYAGVPRGIYVDSGTGYYSTKAVSIAGVITFNGPLSHGQFPT